MTLPLYAGVVTADHPLLTPKVQKLVGDPNPTPADKFTYQMIIAEKLLGAIAPIFTLDDQVTLAGIAIVRQMNFQVEQGIDPFTMSSGASTHSKQSVVFRDRFLDPVAAELWASIGPTVSLDLLLARFSGQMRSVRRDDVAADQMHDPNCSDRRLESRYFRECYDGLAGSYRY